MEYFESGVATDIFVPFKIEDEYVVPTPGSVTYTARDHSGAIITGHNAVPVVTDNTTDGITVSLSAGDMTIAGSLERRHIIVNLTWGGGSTRITHTITVTPWLNISVNNEDVRATLGVDSLELPDGDIHIPVAYFETESFLGSVTLTTALASTGVACLQANSLIRVQACLNILPSMATRVAQRVVSGENTFDRFKGVDFDRLEFDLVEEYSKLLASLSGVTNSNPSVFLAPAMTDPITG